MATERIVSASCDSHILRGVSTALAAFSERGKPRNVEPSAFAYAAAARAPVRDNTTTTRNPAAAKTGTPALIAVNAPI